jgi:hypothetical protein
MPMPTPTPTPTLPYRATARTPSAHASSMISSPQTLTSPASMAMSAPSMQTACGIQATSPCTTGQTPSSHAQPSHRLSAQRPSPSYLPAATHTSTCHATAPSSSTATSYTGVCAPSHRQLHASEERSPSTQRPSSPYTAMTRSPPLTLSASGYSASTVGAGLVAMLFTHCNH